MSEITVEAKVREMETGISVLNIIERYCLPVPSGVKDHSTEARLYFLPYIQTCIARREPILLILPAFPFKSPNAIDKVLGVLPDKGEEAALAHLNGLCQNIKSVYSEGAKLYIVSDGLVYNDLLGIPDRQVWNYGQAIRNMAKENELEHIHFARLQDMLPLGLDKDSLELTQEIYEEMAPVYRTQLIKENLPEGFNPREEILESEDTCLTFRGYCKFLLKDLAHKDELDKLSKSARKRRVEETGREMIVRGKAFASAISKAFPTFVRLSIHPSTGKRKFSISLVDQKTTSSMTPWHATLRVALDGTTSLHHRDQMEAAKDVEVVYENGRPSYFREKSDLYDLTEQLNVKIQHLYPTGLLIRAGGDQETSIKSVNMAKIRGLAERNSPIILRGFSETTERDTFINKANEMGSVQSWIFGDVLVVKDNGHDSQGMNNVLSAEPLPFHFDGVFKVKRTINEDGTEQLVSEAPRFQMFSSIIPAPKGSGLTLFSSSRLLFSRLPHGLTTEYLSKLQWTCKTGGFNDGTVLEHMPLVADHPSLHTPCLRYHEIWPQSRTAFHPTEVIIENGDQSVCDILDHLLYDHAVCYYYSWVKGDIIVSDNLNMMHTRTGYAPGSDREFWRIHIN